MGVFFEHNKGDVGDCFSLPTRGGQTENQVIRGSLRRRTGIRAVTTSSRTTLVSVRHLDGLRTEGEVEVRDSRCKPGKLISLRGYGSRATFWPRSGGVVELEHRGPSD